MAGSFVCVVGPSGAGKDTLIDGARRRLADDPRFVFPRRIVTRDATAFEDHDSLSPEAFRAREAGGAFALSWHAHDLDYAIAQAVLDQVREGRIAVCNLSRGAVAAAERCFPSLRVVLVTAPRPVLQARLLGRGREPEAGLVARLDREAGETVRADLTIENVGPVAIHVAALTRFLAGCAGQDRAASA